MKLILLIGALVITVFVLVFAFGDNNTTDSDFAAEVDAEVVALEAELQAIEADVAAGSLTPSQAIDTQNRVVARLAQIDTSLNNRTHATLTAAQATQLNTALNRLKEILTEYSATLAAVDAQIEALPAGERRNVRTNVRGGGNLLTYTNIIAQDLEAVAEEVIEGFATDTELNAEVAAAVAEGEALIDVSTDEAGETVIEINDVINGDTDTDIEMNDLDNQGTNSPVASDDVNAGEGVDVSAYIGLPVVEAEALAAVNDTPFREVMIDGEPQAVTMDYIEGRLNATVVDGVVTDIEVE
jgi:hypothetical protein